MFGTLMKYNDWSICESILNRDIKNSLDILVKYLNTKTKKNVQYLGDFEDIIQDGIKLKGIRFVTEELHIFRLNWESNENLNSSKIHSVDFWYDFDDYIPSYKILTSNKNMVQIAGMLVVELLSTKEVDYNSPNFYTNLAINLDLLNFNTDISGDVGVDVILEESLSSEELKEYGMLLNIYRNLENPLDMDDKDKERLAYLKIKELGFSYLADLKFKKIQVHTEKNISSDDVPVDLGIKDNQYGEDGVVEKFNQLKQLIEMIAIGIGNSLIITGTPGIGKTYNVEKVLKEYDYTENEDYKTITGTATAKGLYQSLYENRDGMLIIFDDCDDVFKDLTSINILKGALDTKKIRSVSWLSQNTFNPEDYNQSEAKNLILRGRYPNKFNLTSKIIFITNIRNDDIAKNPHLKAILTRSTISDLELTDAEILTLIKTNIERVDVGMDMDEKMVVYRVLEDAVARKTLSKDLSFRTFLMMCNAKKFYKLNYPNDTENKWIQFAQTIS